MARYDPSKSTTSKIMFSVRKLLRSPNVTSKSMFLEGTPSCPGRYQQRGNGGAELGPRDAHGIKGLHIQDVEVVAPIHQHLGQVLVTNDGVDNERVAPRPGDAGRVVTPVEGDRCARPTEKLEDSIPGSADFPESDLVFTLGAVILRTSEDHEAAVRVSEAAPVLG
jgi:hypothetical protein